MFISKGVLIYFTHCITSGIYFIFILEGRLFYLHLLFLFKKYFYRLILLLSLDADILCLKIDPFLVVHSADSLFERNIFCWSLCFRVQSNLSSDLTFSLNRSSFENCLFSNILSKECLFFKTYMHTSVTTKFSIWICLRLGSW